MKTINILLFLSISLLTFGTSCQDNSNNKPSESEVIPAAISVNNIQLNDEQKALAGIETGKVELKNMSSTIECSGQIEVPPQSLISVYSSVNGFVKSVRHLEGDYIKKGVLLTSLSHPELIQLQREYLEEKSLLDFLESEYNRKETLIKEEASVQRIFEEAKANFKSKSAHVKGLKAELDLIGISTKKLLETEEVQTYLNIYAPSSGYISEVNINQGKLVSPSDKLFEIVDNRHLHLELQVFAKDLPNIKKGQRIEAQIPGSNQTIHGKVHLIGKVIDLEKKTALVHGHLDNSSMNLAVGMYLPTRILADEKEVPTVPITAIVQEGGESFIFLNQEDGFEKIAIKTGMVSGDFIEILDWNYPSETEIVKKGAYYIQEDEE